MEKCTINKGNVLAIASLVTHASHRSIVALNSFVLRLIGHFLFSFVVSDFSL
jgi:hypothetical protein